MGRSCGSRSGAARTWLALDARGRRLRAALAAVLVQHNAPALRLMHEWLDNWSGSGLIIAGMTHQGWDVQLTAYAARDWRPTSSRLASRTRSSAARRGRRRAGRSRHTSRIAGCSSLGP